jgi:hypothetical protein
MSKKNEHNPKLKALPTINLREIDPEYHALFKAWCVRRHRTMKGMVMAFIKDLLKPRNGKSVCNHSRLSRTYPYPR